MTKFSLLPTLPLLVLWSIIWFVLDVSLQGYILDRKGGIALVHGHSHTHTHANVNVNVNHYVLERGRTSSKSRPTKTTAFISSIHTNGGYLHRYRYDQEGMKNLWNRNNILPQGDKDRDGLNRGVTIMRMTRGTRKKKELLPSFSYASSRYPYGFSPLFSKKGGEVDQDGEEEEKYDSKFSKDPNFNREVEEMVEKFSKKRQSNSSSLERYITDGIEFLRGNNLEDSLVAFNTAIKIKANTMLIQRGIVLYFLQQYESAKDQFTNDRYLYEKSTGRPGTEEALWTAATLYKLHGQEKAKDLLMQVNIQTSTNQQSQSVSTENNNNTPMNLNDLIESNVEELNRLNENIEMALNPAIDLNNGHKKEKDEAKTEVEAEADRNSYVPQSIVQHEHRYIFRLLYDLFCGNLSPEYVIKAIQKNQEENEDQGNFSLFGNFYLGLYFDALDMHDIASLHMAFATLSKKTRKDDLMWSLPRIYLQKYGNGKFDV